MATLSQLENQIQKLQRRAEALRERKSVEAIASIRALMEEYGLTAADLAKAGLGKKRGRPPGSGNGANGKAASKAKLPPKYRDPATGATWSGHARPPGWIKEAPDRSVYLIDETLAAQSGKNGGTKQVTSRVRAASAARVAGVKRAGRSAAKKAVKQTGSSTAKAARKSALRPNA